MLATAIILTASVATLVLHTILHDNRVYEEMKNRNRIEGEKLKFLRAKWENSLLYRRDVKQNEPSNRHVEI